LAREEDRVAIESIRRRVDISIHKHGSNLIAVVGHCDCAGNPVSDEEHILHIRKAAFNLKRWYPEYEIVGLWIDKNWKVHRVGN